MTPTKLLIGQILIVFAIVLAGVWAATQWAAAMLGYQTQLGLPWFAALGRPVYRPWAIFEWWYYYDAYAPHVFDKAGALAGASGFIGCAAAIFGSLWRARQQRHVTTYGSARWAEAHEMERASLLGDAGAFLGRYHGRYLRHDGPEHVMAFAPTRAALPLILCHPFLGDRLEGVVRGDLACKRVDPLLGGGIEAGGDLFSRFVTQLARCCNSDLGPGAEIERLLPAQMPIVHAPQLRAVRLDKKIQPVRISQFVGLVPGLGVGDLDVIQCHDGGSSKGLAGTIKNTIKADGMPMVPGG